MRWILATILPVLIATLGLAETVQTQQLKVRSGPGTHYRQVGVLGQGTALTVVGPASGAYIPVRFTGGQGWVLSRFVQQAGQPQGGPSLPGGVGTNPFQQAPTQQPAPSGALPAPAMPAPAAPAPAAPATPAAPAPATPAPVSPSVQTPRPPGFTPTPFSPPSAPTGAPGGAPSSNGGSGGGIGNLVKSLLGGGGSNPLASLLGGSQGGGSLPSILNSGNTSAGGQGGGINIPIPGVGNISLGGGGSNPGASAVGTTARVTGAQVRVHSGPGAQYRVVGLLFGGTPVEITASQNGWFQVQRPAGGPGWVNGANLQGGNGSPLSSGPAGNTAIGSTLNGGLNNPLPGGGGGGVPAGAGNERKSRAGFIQLKASGTGYYTYYSASRKWGKPNVIYGIMRVGQRLQQGNLPRLGVGDISAENGGPISGHASHQRGVDVDCRLMYSDRVERPGTISHAQYSSAWTATAIRLFRAEIPTRLVLFNDQSIIRAGLSQYYRNHANHFHFRANG